MNISIQVAQLEEQINQYKKKCNDLEVIIEKKEKSIIKLKGQLDIERLKSHIFFQIIKNNTSINIGEICVENDKGIHFYNFPNGKIPVYVHDFLKGSESKDESKLECKLEKDQDNKHESKHESKLEQENENSEPENNISIEENEVKAEYSIKLKKIKKPSTKPVYRSVKNVEVIQENPEEQDQKTTIVKKEYEKLLQDNNLDISVKDTLSNLEKLFKELSSSRSYTKILQTIRETQNKLIGRLELNEYIKKLETNIKIISDILIKKKLEDKRMKVVITNSLSPLDQRLIFYYKYYDSELSVDDHQKLKLNLRIHMNHPQRYLPFNLTENVKKLCNYGICIFNLIDLIKRVFINDYGFNNLVYLDIEKSTREDPYSFYILEKIDPNGKRCWKMECRLDDLSYTLADQLLNYCITLFRRIYFDVFNDNQYRDDFSSKASIFSTDCEQLLINIICISRQKDFCTMFRNVIYKKNIIKPSQIDKFNFTQDDPINRRRFHENNDERDRSKESIRRLFDNIDENAIDNIISSRI